MNNKTPIGRVIGTERKPNTAYTFSFWTHPDVGLGIGSVVKVVASSATVYGAVVEVQGFNDLESPLHEFLSVGGDPKKGSPTERPEMRVCIAAVLRREPEEPVGAVPIGDVFEADEADLRSALRTDKYADQFGIPAGCYGSKDNPLAVHLHSSFLLGPEAGHMNITGTSGLAAKTSFILFLLKSIFTHYKGEADSNGDRGVAALLFNAKGGDLLYLDRAPEQDELERHDREIYKACDLEAIPFERVRYFAPLERGGKDLNTLRRNSELESSNPTLPFTFGLREVIKHAEVLLNKDDLDAKADAYLQYLNEEFVEGEGRQVGRSGPRRRAGNLDELCAIIRDQLEFARSGEERSIDSHSPFTVQKMYNRISNFGRRFLGLIEERGQPQGPLQGSFEAGTVYVVDVAQLPSEEQDLVFAAFITRLREKMEDGTLGVGRLIVMVDELNKYAPSGGSETYVVKSLKEIAARGRYLGLTLFGAQQFRSRVDKEIVGNAATHAFGHVEAEELAQPGYSYFSPAIREKLGALSPGEVLLKHPHFAQPIFLRFARPFCMKGSDGMRRFPKQQGASIRELLLKESGRFSVSRNSMADALDGISQEESTLLTMLWELRRLPDSGDPLAVIRRAPKLPAVFAGRSAKPSIEEVDPFA